MKRFFNMGQSRPLFRLFSSSTPSIPIIQIVKSVDFVVRIRTQGHMMVVADKTTELWRPPNL